MIRDGSSIRVLFVGDPETADRVATELERTLDRIEVETVGSADAATGRLDEALFDCVVTEYDLPGRDGVALLETVRRDHGELPVLLYAAAGGEAVASGAISAGVSDYLRQGEADVEVLADRVVEAVDSARARRTRREHLDAIDTAEVGISIIEADGVFSYVNEAYADLYGYDTEEMVGERFELTYPPGGLEVVQGDVMLAIEETGAWYGETTGLRADGSTFVEDHTLIRTAGGKMLCSVRDTSERVTEQRTIEGLHSAVRELMSAETVDDAIEVTATAVANVVGAPANVVYRYDEAADALVPATRTDDVTDLVADVPPVERDGGVAWEVFETGERRVVADAESVAGLPLPGAALGSQVLIPMGEFGVLLAGARSPDGIPETDVGVIQTLAAHATTAIQGIQSERDLREEREFIDQAIESLNDVFYVLDPDGYLRRWNDRLRDLSGYDDAELDGVQFGELLPETDRDRVMDALSASATSGPVTVESELRTAAGETIPHEFAGARLTALDEDEPGVVGIARDISRRKVQERKLQRQNERLEGFASIISHDLRNPLSVAAGHLELARKECDSDHLAEVEISHDRMEALIDDILTVAREGDLALDVEAVALETIVRESWSQVETADAELVVATDVTVRADLTQLQQLLENTFRNAVEHGGIDVTVTVGTLDDGFYVEDDGSGLPREDRDRLFEPGFSSTAAGTGLGLDIVEGIVEAHGWSITATDGEPGGARFEVTGIDVGT